MDKSKVLYVEPNYNTDMESITSDYLYNLEDYGIYVDLQVDVYDRNVEGRGNENKTGKSIIFGWRSNQDGTTRASFMGGSKIYYDGKNGKKSVQLLTTHYTDVHYYDIESDNTRTPSENPELFGINSINIEYNSNCVPMVTIQFTDIKGVSLFAPEELRHHKQMSNGATGIADENIAGSFFKCFFTMPYPRFNIIIKGFYGDPVSYELICSDFNATFDSKTGNFGATAKFVGYMYSMLGDISLDACLAAPLSNVYGADYWKRQTENFEESGFYATKRDGTKVPMKTYAELVELMAQLTLEIKESRENGDLLPVNSDITTANQVIQTCENITTALKGYIGSVSATEGIDSNRFFTGGCSFLYLVNDAELPNKIGEIEELNSVIDEAIHGNVSTYFVTEGIKPFSKSCETINNFLTVNGDLSHDGEVKLIGCEQIKNWLLSKLNTENTKKTLSQYRHAFLFNGEVFNEKLNKVRNAGNTLLESAQKTKETIEESMMEDTLEFLPSVENIMRITMAHLETLLHILYSTTEEINKINSSPTPRKLKDLGISNPKLTGLKIGDDEIVGAWPKVCKEDTETHAYRDSWIGEYPLNGIDHPEASAVKGLLEGITAFNKKSNESQEKINQSVGGDGYVDQNGISVTKVAIPTSSLDILFHSGNPFSNGQLKETDVNSIIYKMFYRFYNSIILDFKDVTNDSKGNTLMSTKQIGSYDAVSFYSMFGKQISNEMKNMYTALTVNQIIDVISKPSDAWKLNNSETQYPLYSTNGTSIISLLHDIIPFQNISFIHKIDENNKLFNDVNSNYFAFLKPSTNQNQQYGNELTMSQIINNNGLNNFIHITKEPKKYDDISIPYENILKTYSSTNSVLSNVLNGNNYDNEISKLSYINYFYYFGDTNNKFMSFNDGKIGDIIGEKLKNSNDDVISDNNLIPTQGSGVIPNEKRDIAIINKFGGSICPVTQKDETYFFGLWHSKSDKEIFSCLEDDGNGNYNKVEYINKTYDNVKKDLIDNSNEEGSRNLIIRTLQWDNDSEQTLFATPSFYTLNEYEQALKFLLGFNVFDYKKSCKEIFETKTPVIHIPYISLLLFGAYLHCIHNPNLYTKVKLQALSYNLNEYNPYSLKTIEDEYTSWISNSVNGFAYFKSEFSFLNESSEAKAKEFLNIIKSKDELKLNTIVNDNFFKNYSKITKNGWMIFRYSSIAASNLTKLFFNVCIIELPFCNSMKLRESRNVLDALKSYVDGFHTTLSALLSEDVKNTTQEENNVAAQVDENVTVDEIKITFYKYLKIVYDKWCGSTNFNEWTVKEFFNKNFHFIDSFYNFIGDKVIINPTDLCERLMTLKNASNKVLVGYIFDFLSRNRMGLHCPQNFLDLNSENYQKNMERMFKPIPYHDIGEVNNKPHFVCIYNGDESAHANIDSEDYVSDSFVLDNEEYWPESIVKKETGENKGSAIPAFGVSYGRQYQSYFTDISVNMEGGLATEQALMAQKLIGDMYSPNAEQKGSIHSIGSDIFTAYANQSYLCKVTMMGCAWVQPLMYFVINNIPMFRGSYLIHKVTHSITPGNMITTFEGRRMANTLSPFIKNVNIQVPKEQSIVNGGSNNDENNIPHIPSQPNCKYSYFSPINFGGGIDPAILEEEGGYLKYGAIDGKLEWTGHKAHYTNKTTLLDVITSTIISETGHEDELGMELVATALFNRWKFYGNFKDVFKPGQVAFREGEDNANARRVARNVFLNTPMVTVGKVTRVVREVSIYDNNVLTNEHTVPVTITEEIAQKIFGYCTWQGYDKSNTWPIQKYNSKGQPYLEAHPEYWRTPKYLCHHDLENSVLGHVFVAHSSNKNLWEKEEKTMNNEVSSNGFNELTNGLLNAIQKTINAAPQLSCKIVGTPFGSKPNMALITADKKEQMRSVFDIILNVYSDYISEIGWLCEDNNSLESNDYPDYISITTVRGSTNRNIIFGTMSNKSKASYDINLMTNGANYDLGGNGIVPISITKNVNKSFIYALKKKYGSNIGEIKRDCKSFGNLSDSEIIDILNSVNIGECDIEGKETSPLPQNDNKNDNNKSGGGKSNQKDKKTPNQETYNGNLLNLSHTVTNPSMKLVLSNVSSIVSDDYPKYINKGESKIKTVQTDFGTEYVITTYSHCCCTSGPKTWYRRAKININFWSTKHGPVKYNNTIKGLGAGFRVVTEIDGGHGDLAWSRKFTNENSKSLGCKPGDIMTIYAHSKDSKAKNPYTQHAVMWTGQDWRSDYIQPRAGCYNLNNYEDSDGDWSAVLWRLNSIQ